MSVLPLKDFLTDFGYHPLFWPFALFVPLLFAFAMVAWIRPRGGTITLCRYSAASLALTFLAAFGAAAWANLNSSAFPDHLQPSIAALSAAFGKGQPVYQDFATPERYSLHFGPLLYLTTGSFQRLLGPSVFATKLPGTLAAFAAMLCTFVALDRVVNRLSALIFTGLMSAMMLQTYHVAFGVGSDSFLLLAVAFGLLVATCRHPLNAVLLGICVAGAVNFDIFASAYFLPIVAIAAKQSWSRRWWLAAGIVCAITVALPFLIFRQISFAHYIDILTMALNHGFSAQEYRGNIEFILTILFPSVFGLGILLASLDEVASRFLRGELAFVVASFVSFAFILVPASQPCAGRHYFLPFIPIAVFFAARVTGLSLKSPHLRSIGSVVAAALGGSWIACCSIATFRSAIFVYNTSRANDAEARQCLADLLRARAEHSDATLLILPSGDESYKHTFGRFRLVSDGTPLGIDPSAMMRFTRGDAAKVDLIELTRSTMRRLGKPVLCVIPKDGEPFSLRTFYPPGGPLFSDQLRSNFNRAFWRVGSTEFFDIYRPRTSVLEGLASHPSN